MAFTVGTHFLAKLMTSPLRSWFMLGEIAVTMVMPMPTLDQFLTAFSYGSRNSFPQVFM